MELRNALKIIIRSFAILLASVIVAFVLIFLLYLIPADRAISNIKSSEEIFSEAGIYDSWSPTSLSTLKFSDADSIMVATAVYRNAADSAAVNAMKNPRPQYEDTIDAHALYRYINGDDSHHALDYGRYWHGYLTYMIPLLQLFNVGEIKIIIMCVQIFFLVAIILKLARTKGNLTAVIFTSVILFLNPVTCALSLHDVNMYTLMLIFTYIALCADRKRYIYMFLLFGILTSFMDLLSFPLITLGIPLLTILYINDVPFVSSIKRTAGYSFAWFAGYIGMWAGKWAVGALITGEDTFGDAFGTVAYRMTGDVEINGLSDNSYAFALARILPGMFDPAMLLLGVAVIITILIFAYKDKMTFISDKEKTLRSLCFLIVGLYPFVWYFVIRNHTIIHPWLEYRHLAIFLWALGLIICDHLSPADHIIYDHKTDDK